MTHAKAKPNRANANITQTIQRLNQHQKQSNCYNNAKQHTIINSTAQQVYIYKTTKRTKTSKPKTTEVSKTKKPNQATP
mgnify:FL=1